MDMDMDMDMDIDGYLHGRREFCVPKRLKNNFISVLTLPNLYIY
jgi:hypothetical protein